MGCASSKQDATAATAAHHGGGLGAPPVAESQQQQPMTDAHKRYHTTAALRSLLTHDEALGGVPIKLLSARWLINFFQSSAEGGGGVTRLERRQALEASHPEAFASAEMIERVLEEVETGKFRGVEDKYGELVHISEFPSMASLSHMCARGSRSDARRERLCDGEPADSGNRLSCAFRRAKGLQLWPARTRPVRA